MLTVELTFCEVPCIGLNGSEAVKHSEVVSFQISTDDQAETDLYWNAIIDNRDTASGVCLVQRQMGLFRSR